jgi:hypothetical protein
MASVPEALKQAIEQHHSATNEFLKGNVFPWKEMCSHHDDVTIVGGWGGYERGWTKQVEKRYEWAAARFEGGEVHFENIPLVFTAELAYSVDIERSHVSAGWKGRRSSHGSARHNDLPSGGWAVESGPSTCRSVAHGTRRRLCDSERMIGDHGSTKDRQHRASGGERSEFLPARNVERPAI